MELSLDQDPAVYYAKRTTSYSEIIKSIEEGKLESVTIQGNEMTGILADNKPFSTQLINKENLVNRLLEKNVRITVLPPKTKETSLLDVILSWLPFAIFITLFWFTVSRPMLNMQKSLKEMEEIYKSNNQ